MKIFYIAFIALLGTVIGLKAADTSDLTWVNNGLFVTIIDCDIEARGTLLIPEKFGGITVRAIGDGAFRNCTSLTNITIPDGVESIGKDAFGFCTSLPSITIPDSVTSIGYEAFRNCTSLTSITIPDSVTVIGNAAFAYCSNLTSVTIGNGVTSIGAYAFADSRILRNIFFDGNAPTLGSSVFRNVVAAVFITRTASGFGQTFGGLTVGINQNNDADGDGVPDGDDSFPNDPTETVDTDNDGVGDNADVFPDDPTESADCDNDGVGDNADARSSEQIAQRDTRINELEILLEQMTAERDTAIAERDARPTQASFDTVKAERDDRPTLSEVKDARLGSVVLQSDGANDTVKICFSIEETDDFKTWTSNGEVNEIIVPLEAGKRFYRFALEDK